MSNNMAFAGVSLFRCFLFCHHLGSPSRVCLRIGDLVKRTAFGLAAIVALIATSAIAADLMPLKAPPLQPAWSWTGFYVGANVGGEWGRTTAIDQLATNGVPFNAVGDTFSAYNNGPTGGITAGYNWQISNLVAGAEGDLGALIASSRGTSSLAGNIHVSSSDSWFGTIRGRLGLAFEQSLIYGTGGYIDAPLRSHVFTDSGTALTTSNGSSSGWIAGGGVEHMLTARLSAKLEYLHYDMGTALSADLAVGHHPIFS